MDKDKLLQQLLAASDTDDGQEIRRLLAMGADVHGADEFGLTPLMRAALYNAHPEAIRVLVEAGGDVGAREPQYKSTALQLAANHNPNAKVIEELVAAGSDVQDVNYLGETALLMAVNSGNDTKVIKALVRAGSDVNARDYHDRSALDYARLLDRPYVVKLLKEAGAR